MELENEFSVGVPVEEAWAALTDLERVAPCMPGFELQAVEGEEYRGVVKVKVGPMVAQYQGVASFAERDAAAHRAVVRAEGRETRGQGRAAATVTASLEPAKGGTRVRMHTELTISGRVAQFGRGVLADVSRKLIDDFARALEADLQQGRGSAPRAGAEPGSPRGAAEPEAASEPVDLLATAGPSLLLRVAPVVLLVAVALWLWMR